MTLSIKDILVVSVIAAGLILATMVFNAVRNAPPSVPVPQTVNMETYEPSDFELAQWAEGAQVNMIVHTDYNVDVKITNAHAWKHEGATDALRCLTQNGTWKVLSEKESRNVHLICIDPKTGEAFVAIIAKILRYKDDARNATTFLYTAFKLVDETADKYVEYETQFKAIVINLRFTAGELFFTP